MIGLTYWFNNTKISMEFPFVPVLIFDVLLLIIEFYIYIHFLKDLS